MAGYLRFETPDGVTVLVESDDDLDEPGAVQKAGLKDRLRDGTALAHETFDKAVAQVLRVNAQAFVHAVRELGDPPHEAEISFGLKATGEAGNFVITKVAGEMNYGVRLVWRDGGHGPGPSGPEPGSGSPTAS
ncbi:CU044_2847 family protein [Streptomyces cinnamoneus]|uniref:CU044_2847 family protein n=1 Tax=Streptomyces cinnamoneus TaxID=53446 RepID=UPI0037A34480